MTPRAAGSPAIASRPCGCWVMVGGTKTRTSAGELVTEPEALLTTKE